MWSQTVDEPGPPLNRNMSGRVAASASRLKYATYDIVAAAVGLSGASGDAVSSQPRACTTSEPTTAW